MLSITRSGRILLAATACSGAGVAAGAITSAVADSPAPPSQGHTAQSRTGHRPGGLRRLARRTVHGQLVVHTPSGFRTVSIDRGTVSSVDGDRLTIAEGTRKATWHSETITVPADARVRDDRRPSSLSAVSAGQRVVVLGLPKRTVVIARTVRSGPSS